MSQLKQTAKNIFAIPRRGPKQVQERRASVFGMVESGKTTLLGLLHIICTLYANQTNKPGSKKHFHFLVQERSSNIRQISGELCRGMFPEKTPPNHIFEADFLMRFGKTFGDQYIRLPWGETAGETFTKMLERFGKGQYEINPDMEDAQLIHDYILNTDAVILVAPIPRALGEEKEIGALLNLPDVNLSRLLSAIYHYKEIDQLSNPNYRPIRGVGVFLTKHDRHKVWLESKHMDINTKEGVHDFMSKYFQQTYSVLGWYGLENVRFWATGVEIEKEKNEFGKIAAKRHPLNPARGWKIKEDHNRNVPVFTEAPFYEFIDWLKTTVMA